MFYISYFNNLAFPKGPPSTRKANLPRGTSTNHLEGEPSTRKTILPSGRRAFYPEGELVACPSRTPGNPGSPGNPVLSQSKLNPDTKKDLWHKEPAKGLAACVDRQASGEPGITTVMLVHPTGK